MREHSKLTLDGLWDEGLIAQVADINERLLATMHHLARHTPVGRLSAQVQEAALTSPRRGGVADVPPLLGALLDDWCTLEEPLQRRLAACPYLLIDAGFGNGAPWGQPGSGPPAPPVPASVYFHGPAGTALLRQVLLIGWHLSRSNPLAARVLLGMSGPAAVRVSGCSLQQLEALAEQRPGWIVPRWEAEPTFWQQLLRAVRSGQTAQLRKAQLHGLQLLAASVH